MVVTLGVLLPTRYGPGTTRPRFGMVEVSNSKGFFPQAWLVFDGGQMMYNCNT